MNRTARIAIVVLAALMVILTMALLAALSDGPGSALPSPDASVPAGASASATSRASSSPGAALPALPDEIVDGSYTLAQLAALLEVAPEAPDGYERDLFRHWIDADHDGCDTRDEVLLRDAREAPTVGSGCKIAGGEWFSVYDALTFDAASRLDVDHVVPLAEAWRSGARDWSAARREAFANDLDIPVGLLAVSAGSNRSKGDKDPTDWMPPQESFACTYLADWLTVKARWSLTLDERERATIALHTECAGTEVLITLYQGSD